MVSRMPGVTQRMMKPRPGGRGMVAPILSSSTPFFVPHTTLKMVKKRQEVR